MNGLTEQEVLDKIKQGKANRAPVHKTNSIGRIILRNTLTIFNLVNLILALMIISVGSYKNLLFILIAIANTLISIVNEVRAKKTIDKMRLISEQQPTVIRDGKPRQIPSGQLVEGDLMVLSLGDQIIVDSKIVQGTIEVNESFITGEQDNIAKHPGDRLVSGSFVVSGTCQAIVTAVGPDSQLAKLEQSAHRLKTADSKLFTLMNNIVKYISFALIPIGALLLWARFRVPGTTPEIAVTSTVAALINMIPEGLILLTSSVLALATIRLSRKQVLVQDLYSIETLARVDTICLDKTGTLTTGRMTVKDVVPAEPRQKNALENALKLILSSQDTDNATSIALKAKLLKKAKFTPTEQIQEIIPFSSDRKYSGVVTNKATYLMGAAEFITDDKDVIKQIETASEGYRAISVFKLKQSEDIVSKHLRGSDSYFYNGHGRESGTEIPGRARLSRCKNNDREPSTLRNDASDCSGSFLTSSTTFLGYALLEDELRQDAKDIINYFADNDVTVKIISGDNLQTVQSIARQTGVKNTDQAVDLSTIDRPDYAKLVKNNTIFARVTPAQKKNLIKALKKQGSTVAMTGDGVNDILAMKEADVSIAIGEGSDAARRSAKLVLLDSGFEAVPSIIAEGRQSINNLERSTTLFLSKTVYASILAVLFTILPLEYPYAPIEMSLLNFVCIGLPGLVLALEKNTARIKNQFVKYIKKYSIPTGVTVSVAMLILAIVAPIVGLSRPELICLSALITFVIDVILIYRISKPLNFLRTALILVIILIFTAAFLIPPFRTLLT